MIWSMPAARRWAAALLLLAPWVLPAGTQAEEAGPPLVLERTIPLPGVSGRIDHMAVDLRRGRLFVAELGNGAVDLVDLAAGRQIASWQVPGLKANYPLALDAAGATLATVFRSPPRLALLDADRGCDGQLASLRRRR